MLHGFQHCIRPRLPDRARNRLFLPPPLLSVCSVILKLGVVALFCTYSLKTTLVALPPVTWLFSWMACRDFPVNTGCMLINVLLRSLGQAESAARPISCTCYRGFGVFGGKWRQEDAHHRPAGLELSKLVLSPKPMPVASGPLSPQLLNSLLSRDCGTCVYAVRHVSSKRHVRS